MASEADEILRLFDVGGHADAVLCTLVELVGSGYRRPGARLLITRDASGNVRRAGMISGGCLEKDLCRRAFDLARGGATVVAYDTREEAPVPAGFDSGCEGVTHVFIEPATAEAIGHPRLGIADALIYHGRDFGRRYIAEDAPPQLAQALRRAADLDAAQPVVLEDGTRALIDPHHPPRRLAIFGDGDDVAALVTIAEAAGFDVIVCGRSPTTAERYPSARIGDLADLAGSLRLGRRDAAVLLTHGLKEDASALPVLLASPCFYVGLLGPRKRAGRLMRDLHAAGRLPDASQLDRLHSPAGLDLGGDGPRAVALSVVAEIEAAANARDGSPLRDRPGRIHVERSVREEQLV